MKKIKILFFTLLIILLFSFFTVSVFAAESLKFYINGSSIPLDKGYTWSEFISMLDTTGDNPINSKYFGTDFEFVYCNGRQILYQSEPVSFDDQIVPGGSYSTGEEHNHTWSYDEDFVNSHYKCETITYEQWCTGCGFYSTSTRNPLTQHNKSKINSIVSVATCISPGTAYYSCECGYLFEDELIEYTDSYNHSYTVKSYPGTCTTYPYSIKTCELCGETIKSTYGELNPHTFVLKSSKSSTCTEGGFRLYECEICGETKETKTAALGHKVEFFECKRNGCDYSQVADTGKAVGSWFTNTWNDISGGASKLWNDAGKEINKFTTSAGNWFSGLGKGIEEDFNAFIETITGNKKENSDEPNFWDEIARILTLIAVIAAIVFLCFIVPPIVKYFTSKGSQDKQPKPQNKVSFKTNNYRYNYRNNYRHY